MAIYALLGATGGTGAAIIRAYISQPPEDIILRLFVRSKSKLLKLFPALERPDGTKLKYEIIEGTPENATALSRCLQNVDVIFMCIASNVGKPGTTLVYDTAAAIVSTLQDLKRQSISAKQTWNTPTILQLRSVEQNPRAVAQSGPFPYYLLWFILYHVYSDVDRGYELYAAAAKADPELLHYISVDPPGLMDAEGVDPPTGYELSLEKPPTQPAISYADLGVAFTEIARRRQEFWGEGVLVGATGKVRMTWSANMGMLMQCLWERIKQFA